MAGWISSKLKVAETFLQQIDQQAAESLGKGERRLHPLEGWDEEIHKIGSDSSPPLHHQLPKRNALSPSPSPLPSKNISGRRLLSGIPAMTDASRLSPRRIGADLDVANADWTQLLSSSKPVTGSRKKGSVVSGRGRISKISSRDPNFQTQLSSQSVDVQVSQKPTELPEISPSVHLPSTAVHPREDDENVSGAPDGNDSVVDVKDDRRRVPESSEAEFVSDCQSDSDGQSRRVAKKKARDQMVESKDVASAAVAAAIESIKERENLVSKLEGEKDALEKIIKEQEKQQAAEASQLQSSMIESMEAVDIEKQKHNTTRMEALARLAKLEAMNAELAINLATAQWNLEIEVNHVAELQQQTELKEQAQKGYLKTLLEMHQTIPSSSREEYSRRNELEQELFDAEQSYTCDKIAKLEKKAKKLQENIEMTKSEMVNPSDLEVELKRRLAQLTDHLIQKQSEIEALCSNKAMVQLRFETVSQMLSEDGSTPRDGSAEADSRFDLSSSLRIDIDSAALAVSSRPEVLPGRVKSGKRKLWSVLHQLDSILSSGAILLKRNPAARLSAFVYLLCLHLWVVFIFTESSVAPHDGSEGGGRGAFFSANTSRTSAT